MDESIFYLKQENNCSEVELLSSQYLKMFMDILTGKFKYTYDRMDVYKNLDMLSFETSLNYEGKALTADTNDGVIAIPWSYQYGVGLTTNQPFYRRFTESGFANPAVREKQNLKIGENCVVCYNTPATWQPIVALADCSNTLAHIDLSLKIAVINGRMTGVFEVENEQQRIAIMEFYENIKVGKPAVITGSHMMSHVNYLPQVDSKAQTITELINARNNVLRYALRFCSLRISKDKAEAVLSNESEDEQSFLDANIEHMLNNRKEACRQMTEIFGQSITVDIADYMSKYSNIERSVENAQEEEKGQEIDEEMAPDKSEKDSENVSEREPPTEIANKPSDEDTGMRGEIEEFSDSSDTLQTETRNKPDGEDEGDLSDKELGIKINVKDGGEQDVAVTISIAEAENYDSGNNRSSDEEQAGIS